jgi:glycosyltransferase involved in cell wall biosynthesis
MTGSFKTVTQGMDLAIKHHGKLSGLVPGLDFGEEAVYPGVDAPVSVAIGIPGRALKAHVQGAHKHHWLLLAPNSNGVPRDTREMLSGKVYSVWEGKERPLLDGFFAPSTWAKQVLEREFPQIPVILWQHGVLPHFQILEAHRTVLRELYAQKQMAFMHMASTKMSRKGTRELLSSWKGLLQAFPDHRLRLDLLVNPANLMEFSEMVKAEQARNVLVIPGQGYSDKRLVDGLTRYHGVIQPSRAEGFGLVPLEARACGVPVVVTTGTGHADHCSGPGVVSLPLYDDAPSDDYFCATAPTIRRADILEGMEKLVLNWEEIEQAAADFAPTIQTEWAWENKARRPLQELEKYVQ